MGQTCKIEGCSNPTFGGGVCKYHAYTRQMRGGDKYKAKVKQNEAKEARSPLKRIRVPSVSKKRKNEQKYYAQHCKERTQELRDANNGKVYCFFTGEEIKGAVTYHHLLGRSGDYYLDKDLLVPAENDVHIWYHSATVEQLKKTDWYAGFLERLKSVSQKAYDKESRKSQKQIIFEEEEE